jgi:metallophosphoesterase (TIGR00282 family)
MNILCLGDVVGKSGRNAINDLLGEIKKEHAVDFAIVNAENAAGGSGITSRIAGQMFGFGCDVITLGDHVWDRQELEPYLNETPNILRPANFPDGVPGKGWCVAQTASGVRVGVINLLGRVFMRYNVDCPFRRLEDVVARVKQETNIIVVDFHAETTSEKTAMGFFIDGKVSAVVGTHTHIQTADEKVLPQGTAYITDLGMTGPYDSVIGQVKEKIIKRFVTSMPAKFEVAQDDVWICGVVLDVDEKTGLARKIFRVQKKWSG